VALIFRNCGNLSKKNRNCGNLSKKSKKIGNMETYLYLKIRYCGNLFKKSELWEHIYISTIRNCGNIYNRNYGTCHSELWDPSAYAPSTLQIKRSRIYQISGRVVAGLWRRLYVEWRNYAINYVKRPMVTL
jgi:hypothetical protein